ncbi:hypothetical protein SAMN00790413_02869 [Deinococcus hopiensis KR-140]|uniref:Uncharacterized protein n=1 Tax=Deinococcus hopiensis KR-140 TaxID=695939 RepID=A0A1W1VQ81_9DEIO|nr:hypothetical protein SAMN00790413_02869 [Deinococcus hopiensis KR-140]
MSAGPTPASKRYARLCGSFHRTTHSGISGVFSQGQWWPQASVLAEGRLRHDHEDHGMAQRAPPLRGVGQGTGEDLQAPGQPNRGEAGPPVSPHPPAFQAERLRLNVEQGRGEEANQRGVGSNTVHVARVSP